MMRRSVFSVVVGILVGVIAVPAFAASLSTTSQTLTPYRTCTITATPASTSAVADATVLQANPTTNLGTSSSLTVASSVLSANGRTYVRFDLTTCSPNIPASATVRMASLRLFVTLLATTCRTYDLFSTTSSWTETGITWNNQPFGTAINNPPTGSRSASFNIGAIGGCQNSTNNTYVNAMLTSDVQSFVAGSTTNFGWMLRDDAENSVVAQSSTFSSKDAGVAAQAPQLIVTYVEVP